MKNLMVYYRIVSYIIFVLAVIFSFFDLVAILIALANPFILINVFVLTCVIIYSFISFSFFYNGIQKGRQSKPGIKDWIKVNAYVSIVFSILSVIQCVYFLSSAATQADVVSQFNKMEATVKTPGFSAESFMHIIKGLLCFLALYGLLLLSHIVITLRFVKLYEYLFGKKVEV